MFRLVLCLVFTILRAESIVPETENPEIRLCYNHDGNEIYTVWKDKPLKIVIENGLARYIWCGSKYVKFVNSGSTTVTSNYNYKQFVPETEFNNNIINIINVTKVTAEMSTRWVCTVLQSYHGPVLYLYKNREYTAKDLHFSLHVKGAREVILIANNQSLTTNVSVKYDGEVNYAYEDGEGFPMDFSCKKAKDNHIEDTLRLEYYNAEGILLVQTKPREKQSLIFRSVLKSNNDKYYLDCIRATTGPEREYRYRTTFFKRDLYADAVPHAVMLSVNGQKLITSLNNDKSYDDYIFRYIDGEVLTVTCHKMDVNMRGSLIFYGAKIMTQTLRSPSEAVISINISTSDFKNKSLICSINNTDVEKPYARLLFLSDVPANGVRVRGLSRNNVLYQYTNDANQWTIEYQFSVNDTLNLTCVANGGFHLSRQPTPHKNPFQWKFENNMFDSAAITAPGTPIEFSELPFTKVLNASHNGTKIKCIYFPNMVYSSLFQTVEIILRLKPELVSEAKMAEDSPGDNAVSMVVPIAVGVGVAIAIITMVCLVLWRKRTKRTNLIENEYDNLSNHNDSPIPAFPSQWEANYDDSNYAKTYEEVMQENYNYSTDNDKLHSMPYKRQSNTSENHYTEIDDYFKLKPDGLAANWNTAQPFNYNKQTDTLKATPSQSSNNASDNNFSDSKEGTYEKLRQPINNGNENYTNVQKPSKNKSVTFRQMSKELRPERDYSEGNSRQGGRNNDRKVKSNIDGYYANTGQDIYMHPGDMHRKPNYENNFLQNEKTDKPLDSDYAEPYDEFGISCKNDLYG